MLVSPDLITPLTNLGGFARWAVAIPTDPTLIGGVFLAMDRGRVMDEVQHATAGEEG